MIELLSDPQAWISLFVLTAMEIVLGIDNIVFITILCGRLPEGKQLRARRMGLSAALLSRIVLLLSISWVMKLTDPLFELVRVWSGKDLILVGGGLFLLYKATVEIHHNVNDPAALAEDHKATAPDPQRKVSFTRIILQIMVLDVVFSLDSVITAVGMADHLPVMIGAVLISVGIMLLFAGPIGDFVQKNASIRVLALSFLVLIGAMLLAEGSGHHVSKGYIYVAMAFSLTVELLNMKMRSGLGSARNPMMDLEDDYEADG